MATKTIETPKKPNPLTLKDEQGNALFIEVDGEIIVRPGTVPAETIQKEIEEGVHHAGA